MTASTETATTYHAEDFGTREVELRLTLRLTIHPEAIERVDDEWRSSLYNLHGEDAIVEHLLYNLLQGRKLDQLDGWADMPSFGAFIEDIDDVEVGHMGDPEPLPEWQQESVNRALVSAGFSLGSGSEVPR